MPLPMPVSLPIPAPLQSLLGRYLRRHRTLQFIRWTAFSLALVFFLVLLECLADRLWHLRSAVRLGMLILDVVPLAYGLRLMWGGMGRCRAPEQSARYLAAAAAIERRTGIFQERLLTLTSQFLESPHYQGSPQFIDALKADVLPAARDLKLAAILPITPAWRAWLAPMAVLALATALLAVPHFGLLRLLHRLVCPLAHLPPVTIVQLVVEPGDAVLIEGQGLVIHAAVEHFAAAPALALSYDDGHSWSRQTMQGKAPGTDQYVWSLGAVDRDLRYVVRAGDASSDIHFIRVHHPPKVARFFIRYTYPSYTHRAPTAIANTDGSIEAPVGSSADLLITATEPLASVVFFVNKSQQPMTALTDGGGLKWSASVKVDADAEYELELVSLDHVSWRGPGPMTIHALPDRPPLIRFVQPTDDIQLGPRDVAHLRYEAMDDYGLAALAVRIGINSAPQTIFPLTLGQGLVRVQSDVLLDMSLLNVRVGDVVQVAMRVEDSSGQKTISEVRRVLVAPQAVSTRSRLRLSELADAAREAALAWQSLKLAAQALADYDASIRLSPPDTRPLVPDTRSGASVPAASSAVHPRPRDLLANAAQALASAAVSSSAMRLEVLRALVHGDSPADCLLLVNLADAAEIQWASVYRIAQLISSGPSTAAESTLLAVRAAQTASSLRTLYFGDLSAQVLATRSNLNAAAAPPLGDRAAIEQRHRAIDHLRTNLGPALKVLGIDPSLPDPTALLDAAVADQSALATLQKPADLLAGALEYVAAFPSSGTLAKGAGQRTKPSTRSAPRAADLPLIRTEFPLRLRTAADAEALRPDANYVLARDLDLAWQVVIAVSSVSWSDLNAAQGTRLAAEFTTQFVPALSAMLTQGRFRPGEPLSDAERRIRAAAVDARSCLLHLLATAKGPDSGRGTAAFAARQLESLIFEANAAMSFDAAAVAACDEKTFTSLAAISADDAVRYRDGLDRFRQFLSALDKLASLQSRLVLDTAADDHNTARLLPRQREIIAGLATLPHLEGDSLEMPAAAAPSDSRQAAAAALWQCRLALLPLLSPIKAGPDELKVPSGLAPAAAAQLLVLLRSAEPESAPAIEVLVQSFIPALEAAHGLGPATSPATRILAADPQFATVFFTAQLLDDRIADVQAAMVRRAPLAGARLLAQLSADCLDHKADMRQCVALQRQAISAMHQAWSDSARRAAIARLSIAPALEACFQSAASAGAQAAGRAFLGDYFRSELRPGVKGADANAPSADVESAVFHDAVRAYFEALARPRDKP